MVTRMLACADARHLPLADGSVQCCVTSPPYWGLRKYAGEQELIWENGNWKMENGQPCAHKWAAEKTLRQAGGWQGGSVSGLEGGLPEGQNSFSYKDRASYANTCRRCGAWRGAYGLEPTVVMYVEHTVEVLREVWRVLRDDGVLCLNLGDSHAGGGNKRGNESPLSDKQASNRGATGQVGDLKSEISKGKRIERGSGRWGGGDTFAPGLKPKDRCLIPFRVALAAQADGWWVRDVIVWAKPNPRPESVTDRCTDSYEFILMLTKRARYFWDAEAVKEPSITNDIRRPYTSEGGEGAWQLDGRPPEQRHGGEPRDNGAVAGRNLRNVWTFATQPYSGAHFATFPEELPRRCILAATSAKGACRMCGGPWERVVRSQVRFTSGSGKAGNVPAGKFQGSEQATSGEYDIRMGPQVDTQTIGWRPGCECRGQHGRTVPCVVLDPFGGSGTTGRVALELGRRGVLVDLAYAGEQSYAPLAQKRTSEVQVGLNF
jgi:DNA modification methylase